eukprot:8148-Heterococcus_DN1.PRE.6
MYRLTYLNSSKRSLLKYVRDFEGAIMKALSDVEKQSRRKAFESHLVKYYNRTRAGMSGSANFGELQHLKGCVTAALRPHHAVSCTLLCDIPQIPLVPLLVCAGLGFDGFVMHQNALPDAVRRPAEALLLEEICNCLAGVQEGQNLGHIPVDRSLLRTESAV